MHVDMRCPTCRTGLRRKAIAAYLDSLRLIDMQNHCEEGLSLRFGDLSQRELNENAVGSFDDAINACRDCVRAGEPIPEWSYLARPK